MNANSMLCTKGGIWVHGRCASMKRVTIRLATRFAFPKNREMMKGIVDSIEKLCDEVEIVNEFCYLGDRLNDRMVVKRKPERK